MDSIYPPDNYRASEPINLQNYFHQYSELVQEATFTDKDKRKKSSKEYVRRILEKVGFHMQLTEVKKLANICSETHLRANGEHSSLPASVPANLTPKLKLDYCHPLTEEAKKLHVVETRLRSEINPMMEFHQGFKRTFYSPKESQNIASQDMLPGSDFILLVLIYRPKKYFPLNCNQSSKLQFSHSIELLGRNTLTDLRDLINCASDAGIAVEVESPLADYSHLKNAKEKYPSGFFFIENVFYNDNRHPSANDYSEVILKWANDKGICGMTTANMDGVQVNDLTLRLGYPYLYMHQGDCEHIMVFSDAKLLQKADDLCSVAYPRLAQVSKHSYNHQCYLCCVKAAEWIVQECPKYPQERIFLCTQCCVSYNYVDGHKVCDFKLYPLFYEPF